MAAGGGQRRGAAVRAKPVQQEELDPPRARVVFPGASRANIGEQLDDALDLALELGYELSSPARL